MLDYQREFIQFAIAHQALRFGEFTLKSGRISPYFFNTGLFNSGHSIACLGKYYAETIVRSGIFFDMLFGPAYKGIPLVVGAAVQLAVHHDRDVPYAFNRKEVKDHGEGGNIVGAPLRGRVLIIDDVISAGTSVTESIKWIRAATATPVGVVITLDRQERAQGVVSAVQEVEQRHGIPVLAILSLDQLLTYLESQPATTEVLARIRTYRAQYGV